MSTLITHDDDNERRNTQRVPFGQPVRVASANTSRIGVTVDVSRSGLRVDQAPELEIGQQARCTITLGSQQPELRLACRVIWVDPQTASAGLAFEDITDGTGRRLQALVSRLELLHSKWDGVPIDPMKAETGTWAPDDLLDDD